MHSVPAAIVPAATVHAVLALCLLLGGCGESRPPAVTETAVARDLMLSVGGQGELRSSKPTPLMVPGADWASRRITWMLPEGSMVRKGDLIARFTADEGKQDLAQAMIDLQRNTLARAAKQGDLSAAQGRVAVDLSAVAVQLAISRRYAGADLSILAHNDVLDAVQDVHYLEARQDTLQWQRGQSGKRGGAELALLDAQRATFDLSAKARQADLDALELRAPADGMVMLSANWSGDKPMTGTTLYAATEFGSLPDTSALEVQIELPQIEAQGVRAGQVVEMFPVGRPDQPIASTLSWVASAAKAGNRGNPVKTLSMRAPIPVAAARRYHLVPGQQMQARIVLLRTRAAISVANVAVRNDDGKATVQVRDGNGFASRVVKLGVRGTARSQVLAGLAPGDEVLLTAAATTHDDAAPDDAAPSRAQPSGVAR
jgi:hypothetical protein